MILRIPLNTSLWFLICLILSPKAMILDSGGYYGNVTVIGSIYYSFIYSGCASASISS